MRAQLSDLAERERHLVAMPCNCSVSEFDYWALADSAEGAAAEAEISDRLAYHEPAEGWGRDPSRGFVYERVPTVSGSSLAYDENPSPTLLVNQPCRTRGVVRVTSPFTVESESPRSHVGQF